MITTPNARICDAYPANLAFDRLHLKLLLGASQQERLIAQSVHIYVKIFFSHIPSSCLNDKLADTICYDFIIHRIRDFCHGKEFKLLEYLCFQLHGHLREVLTPEIKLSLKVEKCNPPVPELEGPASFSYSDV